MLKEPFEIRQGSNAQYYLRVEQANEGNQYHDRGEVEITLKTTEESENYYAESITLTRSEVVALIAHLTETLDGWSE